MTMLVMMELRSCLLGSIICLVQSHLLSKSLLPRADFTVRNVAARMNNILQDNNNLNQASPADSITLGQLKAMVGTVQKPKV